MPKNISIEKPVYHPLLTLNSEVRDWKIKVKVHKKWGLTHWNKDELLMNFEIQDEDGTMMKATLWNEALWRYADVI